jgi:ABC-type sugar transport system ATPase subunit
MMPSDKVHKSLTTSAKSFSKQPSFKVTSKKVDSLKFIMLSGTSSAGKTAMMN